MKKSGAQRMLRQRFRKCEAYGRGWAASVFRHDQQVSDTNMCRTVVYQVGEHFAKIKPGVLDLGHYFAIGMTLISRVEQLSIDALKVMGPSSLCWSPQ